MFDPGYRVVSTCWGSSGPDAPWETKHRKSVVGVARTVPAQSRNSTRAVVGPIPFEFGTVTPRPVTVAASRFAATAGILGCVQGSVFAAQVGVKTPAVDTRAEPE